MTNLHATQRWQRLVNLPDPAALTSMPWDNVAFVMPTSGSDVTGTLGRLDLPFATVQAAVTAALTAGVVHTAVVIAPGDYAEDVVFPAYTTSKRFGIYGLGGENTVRLLSLEVKPPTVAGGTFIELAVENILFGELGGATKPPFSITENAGGTNGDIFASINDCDMRSSAGGVDNFVIAYPTSAPGSSFVFILVNRCVMDNFGFFSPVSGLRMDFGVVSTNICDMRGYSAPAVVLSGPANFTGFSPQMSSFGGGMDVISAAISVGLGTIFLEDAFFGVSPGSASDAILDTTGVAIDLVGDTTFSRGGGTGGFTLAAGTVFSHGNISDDAGLFPPITSGTEVFLALARSEGFDPAATTLVSTDQQALGDELVRGRRMVRSGITGAGPHSISATDHFIGADTATTGAAMTFTLPAISTVGIGRTYTVKDTTGSASVLTPVTVGTSGGDTIDGAATAAITTAFGSLKFIAESPTNWSLV